MVRLAWLGFGLGGAVIAIVSGGIWWIAAFGGLITVASIVLQYIDAKPFDRVVSAAEFVQTADGDWRYDEEDWRANGRISINVYVARTDGTWAEVTVANGIGPKRRFWIAVTTPESFRVIAR